MPTGIKWADLPLAAGINEWTLTSDWMVGCDPRFADKDNGFMVEKQGGGLAVVERDAGAQGGEMNQLPPVTRGGGVAAGEGPELQPRHGGVVRGERETAGR